MASRVRNVGGVVWRIRARDEGVDKIGGRPTLLLSWFQWGQASGVGYGEGVCEQAGCEDGVGGRGVERHQCDGVGLFLVSG